MPAPKPIFNLMLTAGMKEDYIIIEVGTRNWNPFIYSRNRPSVEKGFQKIVPTSPRKQH